MGAMIAPFFIICSLDLLREKIKAGNRFNSERQHPPVLYPEWLDYQDSA